jgi:hypothetical protein
LNNNGNLPGDIPSDLIGRFEEFIRNIYWFPVNNRLHVS